jgi:hypothetical protein
MIYYYLAAFEGLRALATGVVDPNFDFTVLKRAFIRLDPDGSKSQIVRWITLKDSAELADHPTTKEKGLRTCASFSFWFPAWDAFHAFPSFRLPCRSDRLAQDVLISR